MAAQSDRRVNVVATRIYDSGVARSISGALYHVGRSLGMEMDTEAIDAPSRLTGPRTASISILPPVTVFPRWKCFRKSLQPVRVIFC